MRPSTIAENFPVSRVIKGGWHLAGGHGSIDRAEAKRDMAAFVEAGITSFDCADIYTGVEELIGEFRTEYPEHARHVRIHTKCVPDLSALANVEFEDIERLIDRSLRRLRTDQLDLVQFHWWDHAVPRYRDVALMLLRLKEAGKIAHLGVTNFDVPRLEELIEAGVPIVSHQVQYSLLDARCENGMVDYCQVRGISLLCYGTVAGGFLSERWLGAASPLPPLANRSLTKYRLIIDEFGGWSLFQALLETLAAIASEHDCDIATIASAAMLAKPAVAGVIVGATSAKHLPAHRRVASIRLRPADHDRIAGVLSRRLGPLGDVYTLERDREGPHGRIMKYELNR
jgi:aryl-alcohol dehydrogenase-like predicted oxidoreductase